MKDILEICLYTFVVGCSVIALLFTVTSFINRKTLSNIIQSKKNEMNLKVQELGRLKELANRLNQIIANNETEKRS
ncbi:MAG: hypothetical protein GY795_41465 [Desulfobacterales bacterium]|nr:hypothetical protein [Desulfobacterales bacterium]